MPKDLRSFIEANEDLILRVPKTVKRDHLSTLIVQANRPVVFDNIEGYPGWRVADLFFRDRVAQAAVLGTTPDKVTTVLAERLAMPPARTDAGQRCASQGNCAYRRRGRSA